MRCLSMILLGINGDWQDLSFFLLLLFFHLLSLILFSFGVFVCEIWVDGKLLIISRDGLKKPERMRVQTWQLCLLGISVIWNTSNFWLILLQRMHKTFLLFGQNLICFCLSFWKTNCFHRRRRAICSRKRSHFPWNFSKNCSKRRKCTFLIYFF